MSAASAVSTANSIAEPLMTGWPSGASLVPITVKSKLVLAVAPLPSALVGVPLKVRVTASKLSHAGNVPVA
jgi:hypothetical protein